MHRSPEANAGDAAAGVHPGKRTLTQSLGAHRAVQAKPTPGGVEEPAASSSAASSSAASDAVDDPFALHLSPPGVKGGGGEAPPTPDIGAPKLRFGSPGTEISQADAQALEGYERYCVWMSRQNRSATIINLGSNPTTYEYETYEGEWHASGGTGEPPRWGFYNRQGRAQLWGRPESPQDWRLRVLNEPRATPIELPRPRPRPVGNAAVDAHAATGAAVDAHAATGVAVDAHAATDPHAPPAGPPGAAAPPADVSALQHGPPGTPLSQADAQALAAHEQSMMGGRQRGNADELRRAANPTTYEYETYVGEWHASGGTGEPPRWGFYNRQGRAQLWGRPEAPHDWHLQVMNEPRATPIELPRPRGRAVGNAAVDAHAATGAAVDAHAPTGVAVDAHAPTLHGGAQPHGTRGAAPVAEVEAPTVPVEAGGSRALRGVGHVGGAAAGAYGTYEGVRQMQHAAELARQGHTGEAVSHGTEGALNATSGAMTVVGEVGAVAGVEGAAAVGTAAAPLAVAAGTIAADRAGDEHARNTGVMGRRHGVAAGRGMHPHPDGGSNPEHNQDFGDVAESAGHAVERRTGSVVAGAVATAAARVHLIPIAATYGVRQTLGDSGGRSDTTDIEAQDQEQRGAPIAEASPAVRAARERLRAQHRAQAAAQHAATEQARREREAQTGVVAHREGMPITETEVNQRAMAVMREWYLQWGANLADPELMEHARRVARDQLQLERAGIH